MAKQRKKAIEAKLNYSEAEFGDKNRKQLGKDQGDNPTEWDFRNLWVPINNYNDTFPGRLGRMARDAYMEWALSGKTESTMSHPMWMPEDLMDVIESAYPSFWVNKKHKNWFLQHFPIFAKDNKIDTIPPNPGPVK